VFDPPFVHNGHPRMMYSDIYGNAETTANTTVADIVELYRAGMAEARRVLKPRGRLIVKGMDQVEGRRQRWFHLEVPAMAEELGMFLHGRCILLANKTPNYKRWNRQRQIQSYFWVFERERARTLVQAGPGPSM
jgi:ubiquinone/menaquinone biosynthesis C-methylase UbiE